MYRLTREVRFSINEVPDGQFAHKPTNSYGGFPSITGFGNYFALQVTLEGELEPGTSYLRNIKDVDQVVRTKAIPLVAAFVSGVRAKQIDGGFEIPLILSLELRDAWPGASLHSLRLGLSPFLTITAVTGELPMIRLSQKFEFSASHRLFNPKLDDEENRRRYGKCSNPHGHGHNYEVQVTLTGEPKGGTLVDVPEFERIVAATVIEPFDHKNLNVEVPEFREVIPTVENIAATIYRMLKPRLASQKASLASVTVWETPKTWCEYSEEVS